MSRVSRSPDPDRDRDRDRDRNRDRDRDLPQALCPPLSPTAPPAARRRQQLAPPGHAQCAGAGPPLLRQRELEASEGSQGQKGDFSGFFHPSPVPGGFGLPEGPPFAPQPCGSVQWLRFWDAAPQNELHGSVALLMVCPAFVLLLCEWKTSKANAVLSVNRALCC